MSDVSAFEVYATLAAAAQLVGVSEKRIEKWVRQGQLVAGARISVPLPPRLGKLYALADVQRLAHEEGRTYHHEKGVSDGRQGPAEA